MEIEGRWSQATWRIDLSGWRALLTILDPREYRRHVLAAAAVAMAAAAICIRLGGLPLWVGVLLVLVGLLPVGVAKWHADAQRFGTAAMLLGALLTVQGFHTIEHVAQWVQYHVLFWTVRQSVGLLSPANAEVVHFVWNWSVLIVVATMVRGGVRNPIMLVLLFVAAVHAVEHTYTFIRHLMVLNELRALGVTNVTAQGLAGIFGRDGWLARSAWTQGTFLCSLPGLTTATRLDLHFYWNVLEMVLLLPAAVLHLRAPATSSARSSSPPLRRRAAAPDL